MRKCVVIVGRKNSPIYEEEKSSRTRLRVKKRETAPQQELTH